jgi:hypothetical protein
MSRTTFRELCDYIESGEYLSDYHEHRSTLDSESIRNLLRFARYAKRRVLEDVIARKKAEGYEHDIPVEDIAFLWFKRFCVLRFMDLHKHSEVGVISPAYMGFQPEILDSLRGKGLSGIQAYTNVYRPLVLAACNIYHDAMPSIFQPSGDYTESLMPDDLLSGNSILAYIRETMVPCVCEDVGIIGVLIEMYLTGE